MKRTNTDKIECPHCNQNIDLIFVTEVSEISPLKGMYT